MSVADVVAGHFTLFIGVQVGIRKQLLEAGEAGIHWASHQVHDFGVGQGLEDQRDHQVVLRQFIDKVGCGSAHLGAGLQIEAADFYVGSYSIGDRTRAFLKVQDGCDYKCTYCTIPLARGISRSDTMQNVLHNAKEISAQNIKEIVLTGVNIGDYGKGEFGNKKHEHTFFELVKALDKVEGIERLRISSIEPNLLKNETIEFVSKSRVFVPHFHIPLQSGSDELLKKTQI